MKTAVALLGGILGLSAIAPASAAVLDFAGLNGQAYEEVLNYYNGGTGSLGSGPGTNYGISFSSNAIAGAPTPYTNSAMIPGGPGAQLLFFLSGNADIMNVTSGITKGFSFDYSAPVYTGSVTVYSGLNGTGTALATLFLPLTPNGGSIPGCSGAAYCPYSPVGVSFLGIGKSVSFAGTENYIAFADVTIGSAVPGAPEVSTWAMMLAGFAGLGFLGYRRNLKLASSEA
jgi:hypothetical protein